MYTILKIIHRCPSIVSPVTSLQISIEGHNKSFRNTHSSRANYSVSYLNQVTSANDYYNQACDITATYEVCLTYTLIFLGP